MSTNPVFGDLDANTLDSWFLLLMLKHFNAQRSTSSTNSSPSSSYSTDLFPPILSPELPQLDPNLSLSAPNLLSQLFPTSVLSTAEMPVLTPQSMPVPMSGLSKPNEFSLFPVLPRPNEVSVIQHASRVSMTSFPMYRKSPDATPPALIPLTSPARSIPPYSPFRAFLNTPHCQSLQPQIVENLPLQEIPAGIHKNKEEEEDDDDDVRVVVNLLSIRVKTSD